MNAIDELPLIATVVIRVLFLVLFSGAYAWFALLFLRGANLLPPPQRLRLISSVLPRFLGVTWIFVVIMSIGGIGSMVLTTPLSLSSILQSNEGMILVLESVVSLLIIIASLLIQFLFLPRARVELSVTENVDKSLKWLTAKGSKIALDSVSRISLLSFVNLILGIVALVLGVLYSNLL